MKMGQLWHHLDSLMQKRRKSSALVMELRHFYIKPWILSL